jgi:hypothetical protein
MESEVKFTSASLAICKHVWRFLEEKRVKVLTFSGHIWSPFDVGEITFW